jgi:hypothetical protein
VLARDTSHILKLALIYAVCDRVDNIRTQHLQAALAVVDFCQVSARWVFGQATGNKLANLILWQLRRSPAGLTATEVYQDVCHRNTSKTQLEKAFSDLLRNKLVQMVPERSKKGQVVERWFVTT